MSKLDSGYIEQINRVLDGLEEIRALRDNHSSKDQKFMMEATKRLEMMVNDLYLFKFKGIKRIIQVIWVGWTDLICRDLIKASRVSKK